MFRPNEKNVVNNKSGDDDGDDDDDDNRDNDYEFGPFCES